MATDRKTLLRTDRTLVPLFLLTVWSGMELHAAGHSARPEAIGIWSASHIAASAAFTAASIRHIVHHRKWYTALAGGIGGRSRITLLLSVCFLAAALSGVSPHSSTTGWDSFTTRPDCCSCPSDCCICSNGCAS